MNFEVGAIGGVRSHNLTLKRRVLYQLSYDRVDILSITCQAKTLHGTKNKTFSESLLDYAQTCGINMLNMLWIPYLDDPRLSNIQFIVEYNVSDHP